MHLLWSCPIIALLWKEESTRIHMILGNSQTFAISYLKVGCLPESWGMSLPHQAWLQRISLVIQLLIMQNWQGRQKPLLESRVKDMLALATHERLHNARNNMLGNYQVAFSKGSLEHTFSLSLPSQIKKLKV